MIKQKRTGSFTTYLIFFSFKPIFIQDIPSVEIKKKALEICKLRNKMDNNFKTMLWRYTSYT